MQLGSCTIYLARDFFVRQFKLLASCIIAKPVFRLNLICSRCILQLGSCTIYLARDFFVRQFKLLASCIIAKPVFRLNLICSRCILQLGSCTIYLARDFFVRQFKVLDGYILICREGFGLYNGKRSAKSVLCRCRLFCTPTALPPVSQLR